MQSSNESRSRGSGRAGSSNDRSGEAKRHVNSSKRKDTRFSKNEPNDIIFESTNLNDNKKFYNNSVAMTRQSQMTKSQFLQANFKFIVSPYCNADEKGFRYPDELISWDLVLEVIVPTDAKNEISTCPICLDPPKIPKTTKCGHIFW